VELGHLDPDEEVRGAGVRNERQTSYVGGKVRGRGMRVAEWKDDLWTRKRTPANMYMYAGDGTCSVAGWGLAGFIRRVSSRVCEGSDACVGEGAGCARAARDNGYDVHLCAMPMRAAGRLRGGCIFL
jgi:hypothetical protein